MEISRVEGNLEGRGKSRGSREILRAEGMDFPIHPSSLQCTYTISPKFWWSTDILLIINPSTGMDQEVHPSRQGRIDSVKINLSLLRMRECKILGKCWRSLNIFYYLDLARKSECRHFCVHNVLSSPFSSSKNSHTAWFHVDSSNFATICQECSFTFSACQPTTNCRVL